MDSLLKELELKEKQGNEFDKSLKYIKTKVLRPTLLGNGDLCPSVFSELKTTLQDYQKNIFSMQNVTSHNRKEAKYLASIERIEAKLDSEEQRAAENGHYIPFCRTEDSFLISPKIDDFFDYGRKSENSMLETTYSVFGTVPNLNFDDLFNKTPARQ